MSFLDNFRKAASKIDGVDLEMHNPSFFLSTGNYIINKLLYGHFDKALPQGRLSAIAGPSSTGKTFVASNVAKYALDNGIGVFYVDTENAIDEGHFNAIGIDPEHPLLQYASVTSIPQTIKLVSKFISEYRKAEETTPFLIVIDSLDMLETETDEENYGKGEQTGGQGQKEKQLKKMLGAFVHDIKSVPMHMLCTKQVYVNQDKYSKQAEPWKFTESLKFAFSQILLVTKLTLRDKTTKQYSGFVLRAHGFKTRFCKPFQTAEIAVPYDSGMDPFTGIEEAAISLGICTKPAKQSWTYFGEHKWNNAEGFKLHRDAVLAELVKVEDQDLHVISEDAEEETGEAEKPDSPTEALAVVKKKFGKKKNEPNP